MHKKTRCSPKILNGLTVSLRQKFALALAVAMLPATLYPISVGAENHDKKKPPVTIEASGSIEWDQTDASYKAKGDAYIVQGESDIKANQIIAHYKPNNKSRDLTRVIATGSVLYRNARNSAKGEKLDYDIVTRRYVLTGNNLRVTGPQGEMTSNQTIIYDQKSINEQIVTAVGKARYKNSDGRILYGDRLVAILDAEGGLISIDGFGNTKVIDPEGTTATADILNYLAQNSLANLNGNVVVNGKTNVMRGARAEIDFNKDVSRILSDGKGKRVSGVLTQ